MKQAGYVVIAVLFVIGIMGMLLIASHDIAIAEMQFESYISQYIDQQV